MAGRRLTIASRGPDGGVPPTVVESRATRIRAEFAARYAAAQTERQRMVAALDYARASEAAATRGGVSDVDRTLAAATRKLIEVGDTLTEGLAKRGIRRGRAS
jgi:hypothetical protein